MLQDISVFGITLHSYSALAALAGALGLLLSFYTLRYAGLGAWRLLLPALLILSALIGARLLNYAVNPAQFSSDFPLWSLRYGKLSLYGGLISAFFTLLLFCRRKKTSPLPLMDAMVLPSGIGLILLKLGCFLNGCCFGKATQSAWGVTFPSNAAAYDFLDTLPFIKTMQRSVYPTQLFEAAGAAICLLAVLCASRRKTWPAGAIAFFYAFGFTLTRLIVHPLRAFSYAAWITLYLYPIMYACILVSSAAGLYVLFKKRGRVSLR